MPGQRLISKINWDYCTDEVADSNNLEALKTLPDAGAEVNAKTRRAKPRLCSRPREVL